MRRWTAPLLLAVVLVCITPAAPRAHAARAQAGSSSADTVVSITFDDGRESQWLAHEVLTEHGLSATFFVTSGLIDSAGYLTWEQVEATAAAGHEIGGHTVSHPHLSDLAPDEIRREICDDRYLLSQRGFEVRSFAYPYSDTSELTAEAVRGCGYNSARAVGGTLEPGPCNGCPLVEQLPPRDAYRTITAPQVTSATTLADLQSYVQRAVDDGGGWVQYVFHDVCDGCNPLAIRPSVFDEFVAWLAQQTSTLTVRTVGDVIGGGVSEPVRGPAPPPRPDDALVINGSMELVAAHSEGDTAADEHATCWTRNVAGTTTADFGRDEDAHTGNAAERITVSSTAGGRGELHVRHDLGACALPVSDGRAYRVVAWYRSDVQPVLIGWYRTESGIWRYWTESLRFVASTEWREATWTTPPPPPEAVAVSFGIGIADPGFAVVDDVNAAFTDPLVEDDDGGRSSLRPFLIFGALLAGTGVLITVGNRLSRNRPAGR